VLSDFSSRGLLPDPATGCYKSATVIARHHNGGPVNWSSAHNGYLLVANRSATSLRATLREAFGDLADVGEQAVLRGVAAMDAGEQRNGVALVFAEFSLLHDRVLPLLQDKCGSDAAPTIYSFAGFAKWNRAQLLSEYAKGSWGVCASGGSYVTSNWTRSSACEWVEEGSNSFASFRPLTPLPPLQLNGGRKLWTT
jgi:hypothetical protein